MSDQTIKRNNWFDSQQVTENDFDTEQNAWTTTAANNMDTVVGSGVVKGQATQRVLFDLNDVPSSISTLLTSVIFDGEPIYATDAFSNTVYFQPSDQSKGNQLEIEISGASLTGTPKLKVYLFGLDLNGEFFQEVIEFEDNGSKITRNYFVTLVAFMTQDFRGNGNIIVDGTACRNVGGRLRIMEALPFSVATDCIMVQQSITPNMDYVNFKPAAPAKTLDIVIDEIADSMDLDKDDLNINVASTTTRQLPKDTVGLIIGEKFKATTNNLQKISILLSVEEDSTAVSGNEFDWSGDLVVGIRALQKTVSCALQTTPDDMIEFDPEPSTLAEISFDQAQLEDLGVVLTDEPQVVDFVFTNSLLSNPNVSPSLTVGDYYIITIRRSGDISKGTLVLEEAANTNNDPGETDEMMMSVFYQNVWTDIPESDLWFKVYTSAIRITSGTAIDGGVSISSPKHIVNEVTGAESQYIDGFYNLLDVSPTGQNYVIVQKTDKFSDPIAHPSTGNLVYSRVQDYPDVSIVSQDTLVDLINAGNETIILGVVTDNNPKATESVSGYSYFPGLAGTNTFTIIQPSSDITAGNLIGSILIPNTNDETLKYRIIKVDVYDDAYGDVNNDGEIDSADVVAAQALDGYATDFLSGTLPAITQKAVLDSGVVTIDELLRADVTANGTITVSDAQLLQQHISLGTALTAGSTFKRAVLTVESLTNPLTTTPDILGSDANFNTVPFVAVQYRIDFITLWSEENIVITDLRRFIPQTFTTLVETDVTGTTKSGGTNSFYIPGDLMLGGDILDENGEAYNVDFEVNTITLTVESGVVYEEINLFDLYVKDTMMFYDGTLVDSDALDNNQVKVSVALQSVTKNIDGYDVPTLDSNNAIHESISILYVPESGVLRIRTNNLREVSTRPELSTKIIVTVFLKKAGFGNDDASYVLENTSAVPPSAYIVIDGSGGISYLDASYLDGYAWGDTEDQRWSDSSQQLQDIRDALDGYALELVEDPRWAETSHQLQDVRDSLDGYSLETTENQRWADSSQQLQDIRDALDGYALELVEDPRWSDTSQQLQDLRNAIDGDGYTKAIGDTGDGYVAFFTGTNVLAGDNDFYYNRITGELRLGYDVNVSGTLTATVKSFLIDHPTKSDKYLQYGSLEGPEFGVYLRGKISGKTILLPEYWSALVDENSITVQLTPSGKYNKIYVKDISNKLITIECEDPNEIPEGFYFIQAERIDISKLNTEPNK